MTDGREGSHFGGKIWKHIHIIESTLAVHNDVRCLTTIEVCRDFAVLLLTLVTTSRGFTLARSRTTATTDPLVIGGGIVREGRKDRGVAGWLELRDEEGQR